MMQSDYIVLHEYWQSEAFETFIARYYRKNGFGALPPIDTDHVQGEKQAHINQGRWIVDCSCNSALLVSMTVRYFLCPDCGNRDNGGKWYRVMFPVNWQAIEAVLLRRPLRHRGLGPDGKVWSQGFNPFEAWHRNWSPGETLADLQAENRAYGVEE